MSERMSTEYTQSAEPRGSLRDNGDMRPYLCINKIFYENFKSSRSLWGGAMTLPTRQHAINTLHHYDKTPGGYSQSWEIGEKTDPISYRIRTLPQTVMFGAAAVPNEHSAPDLFAYVTATPKKEISTPWPNLSD
jgi:hypothetical protein